MSYRRHYECKICDNPKYHPKNDEGLPTELIRRPTTNRRKNRRHNTVVTPQSLNKTQEGN